MIDIFESKNPGYPPPIENIVVGDCWEWTGYVNAKGYGILKGRMAHRVVYETLVGPVDEPEMDHLCKNKACVNPDHLEPVSSAENVRRRQARVNRHICVNGHDKRVVGRIQHHCKVCRAEYYGGTA